MKLLYIVQIIVPLLLIITILLQSRGTGLSSVFGGEGNVFRTKRGAEKILLIITIILAILFLGLGLVNIIVLK